MKADAHTSSENIWAFVHGELDEADRRAFESDMAGSAELRAQVERARHVDVMVRTTLAELGANEMTDDALEAQALAAWEREHEAAAKTPAVSRSPFSAAATWLSPFRRPSFAVAGLAAAAALVLSIAPLLRSPSGVRWESPTFVALALRGASMQAGGQPMDAGSATRCQKALTSALTRAVEARRAALPPGLIFSLRLQELRAGAFSVCVQARSRRGRVLGEWSGDYSSMESFLKQADSSAAGMAETLKNFSGAEAIGGRP